MNNKIEIEDIVPNLLQCRNCIHKYMGYDERFIINGEHYYCDVVQVLHDYEDGNDWIVYSDGECIDGYWWQEGECPYYKAKEDNNV